jgi:hypothetical protein
MATPTVDTFEHDIANEIRQREASISDIATAVGDIGNEPEPPKTGKGLLIAVVILILCGIAGAGYVAYTYSSGSKSLAQSQNTIISEQKKVQAGTPLTSLSPAMDRTIGIHIANVQKTKLGYTMNITSYSPVFAYMLKNESEFGDELGLALGNSHTIKPKVVATSTPSIATTTPAVTGTSTKTALATTTSTTATTTTATENEEEVTTYVFSDITMSNQNMRIATTIYGTVVYAFIGNQKLVISSSTEGILALRSSILQK